MRHALGIDIFKHTTAVCICSAHAFYNSFCVDTESAVRFAGVQASANVEARSDETGTDAVLSIWLYQRYTGDCIPAQMH